ncbi:MAG: hypothetical protein M3415_05470 [Actinomycetota bacterium]|nr:hypothetical protein [Actinomycetota bacterium]
MGVLLESALPARSAGIGQSITGQLLGDVGAQALLAGAAVVPIAAGVAITAVVLRRRKSGAARPVLTAGR